MRKLVMVIFLSTASFAWADKLYLSDGTILQGQIHSKTPEKVVFEFERGRFRNIPISDIQKIEEDDFEFPSTPPSSKQTPSETGAAKPEVTPKQVPQATSMPLVLSRTSPFAQALKQAILECSLSTTRTLSHGGRTISRPIGGGGGATRAVLRFESWMPMDEDMPDTVILQSTGATCRARLGWKWVVTREANVTTNPALNLELPGVKAFVEDPPMGAILCLEGPTTSGSTAIPAGAILENAPQGWCLLTEQEAIAKMKALLKSKRIIKNPREFSMMQYWLSQELGAWGAGAIGPPAKELVPVLVETAESLPQRGRPPDRHPARACVQAIVQIEGKSAQPLLKQIRVHWRKHLVELGKAGWGPLVEFIDSAIDQLQE